jgi:DNA-binding NtrC family response regulator
MSIFGYDLIVIEDNADDVKLLTYIMQHRQPVGWAIRWRVLAYRSVAEADKTLKNSGGDLVLLDLNLVETTGMETVRQVLSLTKLPVIILTGHLTPDLIRLAIQENLCHSLDKNHAFQTPPYLHFTVLECIERHRLEAQAERLQRTITGEFNAIIASCSNCPRWREEATARWITPEAYLEKYSQARFSHGICPDCQLELYGDIIADADGGE